MSIIFPILVYQIVTQESNVINIMFRKLPKSDSHVPDLISLQTSDVYRIELRTSFN